MMMMGMGMGMVAVMTTTTTMTMMTVMTVMTATNNYSLHKHDYPLHLAKPSGAFGSKKELSGYFDKSKHLKSTLALSLKNIDKNWCRSVPSVQ